MAIQKLDAKTKFNALQNADHIFKFKEDGIPFQIVEIVSTGEECKAVVMTQDGELKGLFTDSKSAQNALKDVVDCFGTEQPFITMHIKETAKKQSVYYAEII